MKEISDEASRAKKSYGLATQVKFFHNYHPEIRVTQSQSKSRVKKLSFEYNVTHHIKRSWKSVTQVFIKYQALKQVHLQILDYDLDQSSTKVRLTRHSNTNKTLYHVLNNGFNQNLIPEYLKSLAKALQALHQIKIWHNLIRLQTVEVDKKNALMLDFPYFDIIARYSQKRENHFTVDNIYCAPQMRLSEQFSKEGDIYALGVVFLQIFNMRPIVNGQLEISLKSIKDDFHKKLIGGMLNPDPKKRPSIQQVCNLLKLGQYVQKKVPAFWKQQKLPIYKRYMLPQNPKDILIKQIEHQRQENYQTENKKIVFTVLNRNAVNISLQVYLGKGQTLNFNIIQTDETIEQASQYISSAQQLYRLFEDDKLEDFKLNNQGYLQIFVSNSKWFELKIGHEKHKFSQLGMIQLAIQNSKVYQNFNRFSAKAKRDSLTDKQKEDLTNLQYFWPQVTQELINSQLYAEAIKLSKFIIKNYGHAKYELKGLGSQLQTKGFKVKQIVAYCLKEVSGEKKSPYDQLAICGIIMNNYLANYHFLREIVKKQPSNLSALYSLGCIQMNQLNFQKAAQYFERINHNGIQFYKAQAMKLYCIYKLKKKLSEKQLAVASRLANQSQKKRDFTWILLQLLLLSNNKKQNIQLKLYQIKGKASEYHKQVVYFVFGTLIEEVNQKVALQVFKEYKKLNPEFPLIYKILAQLKATLGGDQGQALSDYIEWHCKFKEAKKQQIYSVNTVASDKQLTKIDIQSKRVSHQAEEGVKYLRQGNFTQAIQNLQQCLEEYENDPAIYYHLAKAYKRNSHYNQALNYIQKTIDLMPQSSKAYYMMGLIYGDLNRQEDRLHCFKRAYEINPHISSISKLLLSCDERSQFKEGLRYIQKLIEIQPDNSQHYVKRANLLFAIGQEQKSQLLLGFIQSSEDQFRRPTIKRGF